MCLGSTLTDLAIVDLHVNITGMERTQIEDCVFNTEFKVEVFNIMWFKGMALF